MAWYERSGPNAATVRQWCKENYHMFNVEESPKSRFFHVMIDCYIDRILEKRINGEEGDYGSYRGFATFGLSNELKELGHDPRHVDRHPEEQVGVEQV